MRAGSNASPRAEVELGDLAGAWVALIRARLGPSARHGLSIPLKRSTPPIPPVKLYVDLSASRCLYRSCDGRSQRFLRRRAGISAGRSLQRRKSCAPSSIRCDFNNGVILTLRNRVPAPRPSHALQIRFEIHSHTFSALKVEQLKVTGEVYKPYKGVRGQSIGNVEWRW